MAPIDEERPERKPSPPRILGRFSYICFSEGLYNVIFVAYIGSDACIIARNLPEEEAKDLIAELNAQLDTTQQYIRSVTNKNSTF